MREISEDKSPLQQAYKKNQTLKMKSNATQILKNISIILKDKIT